MFIGIRTPYILLYKILKFVYHVEVKVIQESILKSFQFLNLHFNIHQKSLRTVFFLPRLFQKKSTTIYMRR